MVYMREGSVLKANLIQLGAYRATGIQRHASIQRHTGD